MEAHTAAGQPSLHSAALTLTLARATVVGMDVPFGVVPAAYVVLHRGGEVLLQLRQGTGFMDGYWACAAAGHVEPNESVAQAAIREAAEELGIVIQKQELQPLASVHRRQDNDDPINQRVDWFFECRHWSGEPHIVEPEKCAQLQWFPLDALPELIPPHERLVLTKLADDALPPILTCGFEARGPVSFTG